MTTADQIERTGFGALPAAAPTAVAEEEYVGRHRRLSQRGRLVGRTLSLLRMFYLGQHRKL